MGMGCDLDSQKKMMCIKWRKQKEKKRAVVNQSEARNRVELFRHLPHYAYGIPLPDLESKFFQLEPMHPSVYKVTVMLLNYSYTYVFAV